MASENLVQPPYRTCRFDDIVSFRSGTWNGKDHGPDFLGTLVANFRKFSSGPNPYYKPYVSLNHKDEFRAGFVSGAELSDDGGEPVLTLDADDVPEDVGQLRAAGAITQPSIEYFQPVYNEAGELVDGFRQPDGTICPTPVLKCLTLLGADSPAVKGLPDLPFAKYNDAAQKYADRVRRDQERLKFGVSALSFANDSPTDSLQTPTEVPTMDRAAMLAALAAMNVDVNVFTEAVPDEVIKAVLEAMQKAQGNPGATPPDMSKTPPIQMADVTGSTGAATLPTPAPSSPAIPGMPTATPSRVTLQFADKTASAAFIKAEEARINQILANQAALERAQQQSLATMKFNDVTAFVRQLGTKDANGKVRIQPAQAPILTRQLMRCDAVRVQKFSDGSQGTELEAEKRNLLATLPFLKLGERLADPSNPTTGVNNGGGLDADRRRRMLAATPQGKEILKKEGAAK